jgi:hypothetical protein
VDDKDVSALDAKAVGKMLRGPVGTSVRIKVQKREGTTPRAYDVTLRRAAPKVQLRLQTTPPNYASKLRLRSIALFSMCQRCPVSPLTHAIPELCSCPQSSRMRLDRCRLHMCSGERESARARVWDLVSWYGLHLVSSLVLQAPLPIYC